MIENKRAERWPMIEALCRLGWSVPKIAKAINWSAATINKDLSAKGGVRELFPNQPDKDKVYGTTFCFYIQNPDMSPVLKSVIENLLEVPTMSVAIKTMEQTYFALCTPVYDADLDPYVAFYETVKGSNFRPTPPKSTLLKDYAFKIACGTCSAPRNLNHVISDLIRELTLTCKRDLIQVGVATSETKTLIDEWLSESKLSPREQSVVIARFGLQGKEERTLKEIAEEQGVTQERIRQIEGKALRKIRSAVRRLVNDPIRLFPTIGNLKSQIEELEVSNEQLADTASQTNLDMKLIAKLEKDVRTLDLSVRANLSLINNQVERIGQLVQYSETDILKMKNTGRKTLKEIKTALAKVSLSLCTDLPEDIRTMFPTSRSTRW